MRAAKYLAQKKISLKELNRICNYLFLDELNLNSKISETHVRLFDEVLVDEKYKNWCLLKFYRITYEQIEFENAKELLKHLSAYSSTLIDELLAKRIINALHSLIRNNRFSPENTDLIQKILNSEDSEFEKMKNLRSLELAKNPKRSSHKVQAEKIDDLDKEIDEDKSIDHSYDDFYWGGLSGEEAYIAYWNCD